MSIGTDEEFDALSSRLDASGPGWQRAFVGVAVRPGWYFLVLAHIHALSGGKPIVYMTSKLGDELPAEGRVLAFTANAILEVVFTVDSQRSLSMASSEVFSRGDISSVKIARLLLNGQELGEERSLQFAVALRNGPTFAVPMDTAQTSENSHELLTSLVDQLGERSN